jgi:hypothetical protein
VGKRGTLGREEVARHTDPVPATGPEGRGAHEGEQKEGLMPKDRSPSKEIPTSWTLSCCISNRFLSCTLHTMRALHVMEGRGM